MIGCLWQPKRWPRRSSSRNPAIPTTVRSIPASLELRFFELRLLALRLLAGLLIAGCVSACVERGDFGRVKPSVWNDALGTAGLVAASRRGEPASFYGLTDDEEELRGRAWRFLEPTHERAWFERAVSELVATRVAPASAFMADHTAYHRALVGADPRSATSSYCRLSEDVMADARLIEPFARVASRVLVADDVRLRSLAYAHDLTEGEAAGAEARVAENRCLIAWVSRGLDLHLRAYRFSIEHLVIETPQADAVPVERGIAILARERSAIDRLGVSPLDGAACAGLPDRTAPEAPPSLSRQPSAPLVRKG